MRIKYLDVLKALAIIAVVLYHSGLLTYGYLGVDLFLVIAGYLTTKSLSSKLLATQYQAGDGKFYIQFEISRIVRLLPPILLAGAFCMVLSFWVMLPDDYENLSQSVVATFFFSNNILAAITTKNYWDVVNEYKPLMHTWYVGILMQFYIVYPLLFIIAKRRNNPKQFLLISISTLLVVSLFLYFITTDVAQRFYYLPSRFFEFAAGGIVALTYLPKSDSKLIPNWLVYTCYGLLLILMVMNYEIIPSNLKLVAIVVLSCVLLCCQDTLENKVAGNYYLAAIGAASYSIFIWHQILLAYCRYTITSVFSIKFYVCFIIITAFISWLSYKYIEQSVNKALASIRGRKKLYILTIAGFVILTVSAVLIYRQGGVVRDVPELYISKGEGVNHKAYNDKIYKLDKPFETNKLHWLVIGNSFGRDFANVILESPIADSVEISYLFIKDYSKIENAERFAAADKVFLSTFSSLEIDEVQINGIEQACIKNGLSLEDFVIVGTKNFGVSNGKFYINRYRSDYFDQRTPMDKGFLELNTNLKNKYGNRYLDLIGLVVDERGTMPVFTPDHHYVSQDCRHFSMGGAKWFAKLIDWNKYLVK